MKKGEREMMDFYRGTDKLKSRYTQDRASRKRRKHL